MLESCHSLSKICTLSKLQGPNPPTPNSNQVTLKKEVSKGLVGNESFFCLETVKKFFPIILHLGALNSHRWYKINFPSQSSRWEGKPIDTYLSVLVSFVEYTLTKLIPSVRTHLLLLHTRTKCYYILGAVWKAQDMTLSEDIWQESQWKFLSRNRGR